MEKKNSFSDKVRQHLQYSLSLPERTVCSLAAVAGGTTALLTDTLFPESIRQTHIYTVTLGFYQQYLIRQLQKDIGGRFRARCRKLCQRSFPTLPEIGQIPF